MTNIEYKYFMNLLISKNNDEEFLQKNKSVYNYEIKKEELIYNEKVFNKNYVYIDNLINCNWTEKEELYNFEYLKEHPSIKININYIKSFLKEIVFSKVFQEVWELYNEEKYFFLDKYIINKLIDDYIRFFFLLENLILVLKQINFQCYVMFQQLKKKYLMNMTNVLM